VKDDKSEKSSEERKVERTASKEKDEKKSRDRDKDRPLSPRSKVCQFHLSQWPLSCRIIIVVYCHYRLSSSVAALT
jgi:hypothetical protein